MHTRTKRRIHQHTQHAQEFPDLFLSVTHELDPFGEQAVKITESRYGLHTWGTDKEQALASFWQLVEIETLWDETTSTLERVAYFKGILGQEEAFKRKVIPEENTVPA